MLPAAMASERIRVQFAHGLESSPQGNKARGLAERYDACTPAMDTRDFECCVAVHAETLARFRPDLLIGSSFGGAVVVSLLQRGLWRGPSLLLAQAALFYDASAHLPKHARVTLVHARQDEIVPIEQSRQLASGCDPALVELIECDDDHALSRFVASGALFDAIDRACSPRVPVG
jgi:predicted esterase